jgi:hypothetical protein
MLWASALYYVILKKGIEWAFKTFFAKFLKHDELQVEQEELEEELPPPPPCRQAQVVCVIGSLVHRSPSCGGLCGCSIPSHCCNIPLRALAPRRQTPIARPDASPSPQPTEPWAGIVAHQQNHLSEGAK